MFRKILCKLKIHFSGICKNGQFICPECGLVLDTFHKYCDNCKHWQETCYGVSDGDAKNCNQYQEKQFANRITVS